MDKMTAPVNKMQNRLGKFTRATKRAFKAMSKAAGKFLRTIGNVGKKLLKLGTGAVVAGLGAVSLALKRSADSADDLAKESRRLNFPIEELQQYKFIAEQSGVSQELLSKSLGAFSKRMGEAAGGMGPLASGLKKINPELLKQLQGTDDVAQALDIVVDAMRNADSATERAAIANAAFSRSGLKLANIADLSAEKMAALKKEMAENGLVTMQEAEQAEAFNDSMNSLRRAVGSLLSKVLIPLMPALTDMIRGWRAWLVANKELLKLKVQELFERLKTTFDKIKSALADANKESNFFDRLAKFADAVVSFVLFLGQHGKKIAIFIATLTAAATAVKIFGIAAAVTAGVLSPMVLAAGAVAAAATLIIANWEPLTGFFAEIGEGISKSIFDTVQKVNGQIDKLIARVEKVNQIRQGIASEIGRDMFEGVEGVKDFFRSDEEKERRRIAMSSGVVTPSERVSKEIKESRSTSTSEVTIRDQTGRAEITQNSMGGALKLQRTGGF